MKLTTYYSLYERFKTGKVICCGIRIARLLGIRHLLVRMDTNLTCNLRCRTCFFSGPWAEKIRLPPMTLEVFKKIAKEVFPKTRILFLSCGGEPLMTKNFENFLAVTGLFSIPYVGYSTNGLLLTEDIIRSSIEHRVKEITLSIDGATRDTYEYIRTGGKFDLLLKNLSLFKEIISRTKSPVPSLRFNFTITRSNHLEMPVLIDLAKQFGVTVVKFRVYTDWGGRLSYSEESLIGHEQSFNQSLIEAKRRAAEANICVIAPLEFQENPNGDSPYDKAMGHVSTRPPCIYPWFYRYIDPLGRIRLCGNLPLSQMSLAQCPLGDFDQSETEVQRKYLLMNHPSKSCFMTVCKGDPLRRANDDINVIHDSQP